MASNLSDIYVGVNKSDPDRRTNDLYATPPLATYVLRKYANIPHKVVEPCAGRGNIAVELKRGGHDVRAFDLYEYETTVHDVTPNQDVLELPKQEGYDAFITNPPYHKDLPRKIAEKGIAEYNFTALFVRLTFLEGMKRCEMFRRNPPSDILFMSDRANFKEVIPESIEYSDQIGGMIAYMWIIWRKDAANENTKLQWILLKDEYAEWRKEYEKRL